MPSAAVGGFPSISRTPEVSSGTQRKEIWGEKTKKSFWRYGEAMMESPTEDGLQAGKKGGAGESKARKQILSFKESALDSALGDLVVKGILSRRTYFSPFTSLTEGGRGSPHLRRGTKENLLLVDQRHYRGRRSTAESGAGLSGQEGIIRDLSSGSSLDYL